MKHILIIVFLVLCLGMLSCMFSSTKSENNVISYENFVDKIQAKESFVMIIGRDDCPNCTALSDMLNSTKNDMEFEIVYLKYTSENKDIFLEQIEEYVGDISLIPYYSIIKEGEIERSGQGYYSEESFWNFMNEK